MKALILSAGQGTRLLPLTAEQPKCALPLCGRTLLEWQIDALRHNGVDEIVVVAGYRAEAVRRLLDHRYGKNAVAMIHNPFFEVADNLASCWIAREALKGDLLLINGDTLFEPGLVDRLLNPSPYPIVLARDHKPHYDDDDMKLILAADRLLAIGKQLPIDQVNGESIGMIRFFPEGARLFRETIERLMFEPASLQQWYLSVIHEIATRTAQVGTRSIHGCRWVEVDYPLDLKHAEAMVENWDWHRTAHSMKRAVTR